jgi:lipid II isoglutaminyl synthase (glutamine-hydrolysing)
MEIAGTSWLSNAEPNGVGFVPRSRRCRGVSASPGGAGIVVLGGGTDRVQEALAPDLNQRGPELAEVVEAGTVVLGICGGYQLLGNLYVSAGGLATEGLGLIDAETRAGDERLVGRVQATAVLWGSRFDLVGFENHGGRTTLGPGARPLAEVTLGGGNNGRDGAEGAVRGTVVGTYLHGPVLPCNPQLADCILERALSPVTGGGSLELLDDDLELCVHEHARTLRR